MMQLMCVCLFYGDTPPIRFEKRKRSLKKPKVALIQICTGSAGIVISEAYTGMHSFEFSWAWKAIKIICHCINHFRDYSRRQLYVAPFEPLDT